MTQQKTIPFDKTNTKPKTIPFSSGTSKFPTGAPSKVKESFAKQVGGALVSSEVGVGKSLAAGIIPSLKSTKEAQTSIDEAQAYGPKLLKAIKEAKAAGKDTSNLERVFKLTTGQNLSDFYKDVNPDANKSTKQALGEVAGVGLDVLSAGSYGKAAKGAESGSLLVKAGGKTEALASKLGISTTEKVAEKTAAQGGKKVLSQTLKEIGKKTLTRSAEGAGTGYLYDVSENLKQGKEGASILKPGSGTALGAALPIGIGAIEAGAALTKETAPRFINSLIKPKQADFSYGKDPGRTVSKMGITGNNLEDFANNIGKARQDVGDKIGKVYSNPKNAKLSIDASTQLKKIDAAIAEAAKGGKNNQTIVTQLQNIKDALLYEHKVDKSGNIIKAGKTPKNISKLNPEQTFDLKKLVSDQTQFTGRASDDKKVNSVLKDIYGGLKADLNRTVGKNNPEIISLNQQYADLTSAHLATKNRDAIIRKAQLISNPVKAGGVAGLIAAISTGGAAIPAILAGTSAAAFEKALESTAVKTRIAAWLGSESPSRILQVVKQNPALKTTIYRLIPKVGSTINK